jgi:hypothetical protein
MRWFEPVDLVMDLSGRVSSAANEEVRQCSECPLMSAENTVHTAAAKILFNFDAPAFLLGR